MANSVVLTSSTDERNTESHIKKTWEQVYTFTVETGGLSVEMTQLVPINGNLREMVIEVVAAAGITGTVNVDLDDSRGVEFDTNATLAESSETIVEFNSGVGKAVNKFTIRVDPSDDPTSGDWEIVVTVRGD